jgi:hypothetical protein
MSAKREWLLPEGTVQRNFLDLGRLNETAEHWWLSYQRAMDQFRRDMDERRAG